jgi:hypothetical protein
VLNLSAEQSAALTRGGKIATFEGTAELSAAGT